MTLVVDASVAAKWFLVEDDAPVEERLLASGARLIAPELILAEVGNTLFRIWLRGAIDEAHMDRALSRLPLTFSRLWPLTELAADAAIISRILPHPIYDCFYVALYWRTRARLVTADRRLLSALLAVPAWSDAALHISELPAP